MTACARCSGSSEGVRAGAADPPTPRDTHSGELESLGRSTACYPP
jgi:hypothetical protein